MFLIPTVQVRILGAVDAVASKLLGGEGGGPEANPPRSCTGATVKARAPTFGSLREAAGAFVHGGEGGAEAERVQSRLRVAQVEKSEA